MILITGISGFLASHIIQDLKSDFELVGLSRRKQSIDGLKEVYTWEELDRIPEIEWCIHLAGMAHDIDGKEDEGNYQKVNVDLTKKLYDALATKCKYFLYFSSIKAVTNFAAKQLNEEEECKPVGPYGISKRAAEEWLLSEKKISTYIFRPVMLYGEGSKGNINQLIKWVKKGIPYPFAGYRNEKSVLYVKNLTFVTRKFLNHPPSPGIYHIADEIPLSSSELVSHISSALNQKTFQLTWPVLFKPLVYSHKKRSYRLAKLNKLLGDLSVNTQKISAVLKDEKLPFNTEEAFKDYLKS